MKPQIIYAGTVKGKVPPGSVTFEKEIISKAFFTIWHSAVGYLAPESVLINCAF